MPRFKNSEWNLESTDGRTIRTWEQAGIAVLMDIRDELQKLNHLLHCDNFTAIPATLRRIQRNTSKPRPARKVK